MAKDLLTVVQTVAGELGIPKPSVAASSTDLQVIQLVALANASGFELMEDYAWPWLRRTASIALQAGVSTYALSELAGAGTYTCNRIICETGWDATNAWALIGDVPDVIWNQWKYGIVTAPIRQIFRTIAEDQIEVLPVPASTGGQLAINFITNLWAARPTDPFPPKAVFGADSDVHTFDQRVFELSVKWRWLRAKGFDYGEERQQCDSRISLRKGHARPARRLSLVKTRMRRFLGYDNAPETGYGP